MDKEEQGHWDHVLMVTKLTDEIERLRSCEAYNAKSVAWANVEIERLREALHQINLCSQNSMSSKQECGDIARSTLKGD